MELLSLYGYITLTFLFVYSSEPPNACEAQLTMAQAQAAVDAAETEARANDWNLTIFVADAEGAPFTVVRQELVCPRHHPVQERTLRVTFGVGRSERTSPTEVGCRRTERVQLCVPVPACRARHDQGVPRGRLT